MQKDGRSQTEPDSKSDPEAGKLRGKTIRDALHDLKHGNALRKIELWLEGGCLGLIGILTFVFVENSMDRPRVIIAILAVAVIGGIVVLWIRVDRYFHTPVAPQAVAPSTPQATSPTQTDRGAGGPRFHEQSEYMVAKIGTNGLQAKFDGSKLNQVAKFMDVRAANGDVIEPFRAYVENGIIYIDTTFFDGRNRVEMKKNTLVGKLEGWDFNYSDNAAEVVDQDGNPVFQLVYETPSTIVLTGAFYVDQYRMLVVDQHIMLLQTRDAMERRKNLRPIFKHPRWKYPGVYADGHVSAADLPDNVNSKSQDKSSANSAKVADGPKFRNLSQILKAVPRKHIPADGKWPPSNEATNSILEKRLIGYQAQVSIEVDLAWKHPDGPNANVAFIIARFTEHPIINLPLLFYAYFNKATPEQAEAVISRKKHDRVYIVGKITRADLTKRDDKGVCLNIDLHDCEFVKP